MVREGPWWTQVSQGGPKQQGTRKHFPALEPVHPLFYLPYHGLDDRWLFEKRSRLSQSSYRPPKDLRCGRHPDGRIHIGFVSQNFKNHTIGVLMHGLIENLDRDRFHVSLLSSNVANDEIGKRIRASVNEAHLLSEDVLFHDLRLCRRPVILFVRLQLD